jgi:ATP-dependent DNA helicase RecG
MLRFVDLQNEHDLIEKTKELSVQLLNQYPEISQKHLERWLGHRADFLKA